MNNEIIWLLVLTLLTLAQAMLLIVKSVQRKKSNPGNYGERIAKLETKVENIEDDIREMKENMGRK